MFFSIIGWHLLILFLLIPINIGVFSLARSRSEAPILKIISWLITALVIERVFSTALFFILIYAPTPDRLFYWAIGANLVKLFLWGGLAHLTIYSLADSIKRQLRDFLMRILR